MTENTQESKVGRFSAVRKHYGVVIAVSSWLLIVVLGLFFHGPFMEMENKLLDIRMRLPHKAKACDQIVYVDIDDKSIALFGRWPWNRSLMAEILQALRRANIVGMFPDFLIAEETTVRDDLALVHAVEDSGNIFLGAAFQLQQADEHPTQSEPVDGILKGFRYDLRVNTDSKAMRATRALASLPSLMAVVAGTGHISFVPDEDGVARNLPLFVDLEGRYFPSIDIEVARWLLQVEREKIEIVPGRYVVLREALTPGLTERKDVFIPVDAQMRILINYAGRWGEAFKHYPIHAILRDLLSDDPLAREKAKSLLDGKFIVLSAAFTGGADMGPTPLQPLVPLSEIHGHVISSIVNQQFLRHVPSSATMLIALPLCLVLGLLSPRLKTLRLSGLSALMLALWVVTAFVLFAAAGYVVDIVWPGAAIVLSYAGCAGRMHWKTERERASLRRAFSQYVSPDVLSQILVEPRRLVLGGERVNLSILVLVFEKFERFSENAEPEEIIELLTAFYDKTCEWILKHGGTIDKFTKDGLIAFFGAPLKQDKHLESAVRAALSIRREVAELITSRSRRGEKTVGVKMAIHSGFATVGNIGSPKRMDYTVIGRNVNLCIAMAESATDGQILVTRKTHQSVESLVDAKECGEVRLSAYPKPFFIFDIIGLKDALQHVPVPTIIPTVEMREKKFLGPYTLTEKLGVGNTGTVYKGYDEQLDRQVAIKVLSPGLQKDRLQLIAEEAKTLAKLSHPNVVQVYYAGEEDGIGFLVMELVDGGNLRELINTEGALSVSHALDIITQTSRGLNAAHKRGITHRDIKPANLLLNNYDIVKVTDFGLAGEKIFRQRAERRIAGTFQYMSPEQAQGLKTDCRSDIYALGITFFHLLAGEVPFKSDSIAGLIWHHAESQLPIEPLKKQGVPDSVIRLVQKMTAKLPGERFANYLELLEELDKLELQIDG